MHPTDGTQTSQSHTHMYTSQRKRKTSFKRVHIRQQRTALKIAGSMTCGNRRFTRLCLHLPQGLQFSGNKYAVFGGVSGSSCYIANMSTDSERNTRDDLGAPVPKAAALCSDSEWNPAAPPALPRAPSRGRRFPRGPPPTWEHGKIERE